MGMQLVEQFWAQAMNYQEFVICWFIWGGA
jgi:hypothetical protein